MSEPKFKLGDDGELEEIIEDFDEKPKRKRKPKRYNPTLQIPLSLMLVLIMGIGLFGLVAYFVTHPSEPQSDESGLLFAQFSATETPGGIMDKIPPCGILPIEQKPRLVYSMAPSFNSDEELLRVNIDGTNNCRLTNNNIFDSSPSWSPDGTKIVYNSTFSSGSYGFENELYIMNANGENITKLTKDFSAVASSGWSPDGKRIVFQGVLRGTDYYQLFVINVDGTNMVNLTNVPRNDTSPHWSPDGQSIVFISSPLYDMSALPDVDQSKNAEIFMMDVDGGNLRQLTTNTVEEDTPIWSADGQWLAFVRAENIFMMDKDGKHVRRLTDETHGVTMPFWMPNGNEVGFINYRNSFELANIETGQIRSIPLPGRISSGDLWSPPATPPHPDV